MLRLLLLLVLVLPRYGDCSEFAYPMLENGRHTFTYDGFEREFYLSLPPTYEPNIPTKMVLLFHGWGQDGSR